MVSGDWFYYPSIGGDSHYIDTPKKGDLEEIPREEIPWDLESWRISRHHGCFNQKLVGGLEHLDYFSIQLGISSSQLTFTP